MAKARLPCFSRHRWWGCLTFKSSWADTAVCLLSGPGDGVALAAQLGGVCTNWEFPLEGSAASNPWSESEKAGKACPKTWLKTLWETQCPSPPEFTAGQISGFCKFWFLSPTCLHLFYRTTECLCQGNYSSERKDTQSWVLQNLWSPLMKEIFKFLGVYFLPFEWLPTIHVTLSG